MKTQRMILAGLLAIVVTLANAGNAPLAAKGETDPQPAQVDHSGALALTWKRSTMWTGDFGGPIDSIGRHWQHQQFDDSSWAATSIPNNGTDNGQSDYYYRAHFTWDGASPIAVRFASDDGLQIYINGTQLGQWGSGWRIPGCVNIPSCLFNSTVPDQAVPTYMLQPGDNVIAIDLWNSTSGTYSLDAAVIPAPIDFTISHIEITQVTQSVNNEVPLIARKDTLVRVYVACNPGCGSGAKVSGTLQVSGPLGGTSVSPSPYYILAHNPGDWKSQREHLDQTLNFIVPKNLLQGDVTLTVAVAGHIVADTHTFHPARTLRIAYVPIHYEPSGRGPACAKEPSRDRLTTAHTWARQVFPLQSEIQIDVWVTLPWALPLYETSACYLGSTSNEANIEQLRQTLANRLLQYTGANPPEYVLGWLPAGSYNRGRAFPHWANPQYQVPVAISDDFGILAYLQEFTRRTFAHEMGHLMGRGGIETTDCPSGDGLRDWPYPNATIQDFGYNGKTILAPSKTYDYMSYCGLPQPFDANGSQWTSPWTYRNIYEQALTPSASSIVASSVITPTAYFLAAGLVYSSGLAQLEPVWVVTPSLMLQPPTGTAYCLEAQDNVGGVLSQRCFDPNFTDFETGQTTNLAGFTVLLPYAYDAQRIVLKQALQEVTSRTITQHSPIISDLYPNGGEAWNATGTYTVTWTSSDSDNDPLAYNVLYSPSADTWIPLATGITQTHFVVNAAEVPGSSAARIRVVASDGFNNTSAESAGTFTVQRKTPQAYIVTPDGLTTLAPNQPTLLQGTAYDAEDGILPDSALQWTSSLDGAIGSGSQVLVSLSYGQHIITLTAMDSNGNSAVMSVSVFIGYRTFLPAVRR